MNSIIFNFDSDLRHMGMEIPRHTQETLTNYLLRGWNPGGFVTAMLAMDMTRALATADPANRQMMWAIGCWITDHAPQGSWGDYNRVDHWCDDLDWRRSQYVTRLEKAHMWNLLKDTA